MNKDSIDREKIKSLLPHREPMLLVNRLINIVHLKSATAIVEVRKNSFFDFEPGESAGLSVSQNG